VHLVGCGAPMLPSVGWVDSMRVGADIAYVVAPTPTYAFAANEARNTASRGFTDHFWALDPDVILLRGDGISDAEAWTAVLAGALAGGNYLLGDARQAGPLRSAMALDPEVLALVRDGIAARPIDLTKGDEVLYVTPLVDFNGDTHVPHQWAKHAGGHHWLAVFGWADDYSATVDVPSGAMEITPPTTASPALRQPFAGHRTVAVPAHGARLFAWSD